MIIPREDLIYAAVVEVNRARKLYPDWPGDIVHAACVVIEESGELLNEANNLRWDQGGDVEKLRKELIQLVAMCMRFAEDTDTDNPKGE